MGKYRGNFATLVICSFFLIHLAVGDRSVLSLTDLEPSSSSTGAIKPNKDKIYFPGTCFLNGNRNTPGVCKSLVECPIPANNWQQYRQRIEPCLFLKASITYVCCEIEKNNFKSGTSLLRLTVPRPIANACKVVKETGNVEGGGAIGEESEVGAFPYMASLGWKSSDPEDKSISYLCGGVLFMHGFVLTAAHCSRVNGVGPEIVRIGDGPLDSIYFSRTFPIKRFISHPDYNGKDIYNDIAIIEFEGDSHFYRPACLWLDENYPTKNVSAIGYGQKGFGAPTSNVLIRADLFLTPHIECSEYYPESENLPRGLIDSQVCAGDRIQRRDTCQGDSGGPMVIKMATQTDYIFLSGNVIHIDEIVGYVIGITSLGKPCGLGIPGIYTKVADYIDWIEKVVGTNITT